MSTRSAALAAAALVIGLMTGCGGTGGAPATDPMVGAEGPAARPGVTLLVKARVRSGRLYGTQQLEPYTAASIRLLALTVTHTRGSSVATLAPADLGSAVRLDGLEPGETYHLQFRAYRSESANPAEQISDDEASSASITLDGSQPTVTAALTVKLLDQMVDARATGGLAIRPGNLIIPAVEATSSAPDVSDLAGSTRGYLDGPGRFAKFDTPYGLAIDASGSVYVADSGNRRVRMIAPDGLVSTFSRYSASTLPVAGTVSNLVGFADGLAIGIAGGVVLADSRIAVIATLSEGATPSVIAGNGVAGLLDGENASSSFDLPSGILVEPDATMFAADTRNNAIRWISPAGYTYTWLGDPEPGLRGGYGRAARFNHPTGLAKDAAGNLCIADTGNHAIRKVDTAGGVSLYAGTGDFGDADGPALSARFDGPTGIAVDCDGSVYVADSNNNCIRRISADGLVTTLSGSGIAGHRNGSHVAARFDHPTGLALGGDGWLYVADTANHRVRKVRVR
ncbi:MAG: hypothetical protein FJZ01_20095 [Candidatus Sericytochromatia bacterium]|nr:hypothetical protein [Candidatus Tanganyikabacteria bacterium]